MDLSECETAKELMFKIFTQNGLKNYKNCIFMNSCSCSGCFQTKNVPR